MSLDRIRSDLLNARKVKDSVAVALLNPLVGEAARIGKDAGNRDTTPEEATGVVRKFLANARELLPHVEQRAQSSGDTEALENHRREIGILEGYMPTQMGEGELSGIIQGFVAATPGAKMGDVMAYLKKEHAGTYDGRMASTVAKSILT